MLCRVDKEVYRWRATVSYMEPPVFIPASLPGFQHTQYRRAVAHKCSGFFVPYSLTLEPAQHVRPLAGTGHNVTRRSIVASAFHACRPRSSLLSYSLRKGSNDRPVRTQLESEKESEKRAMYGARSRCSSATCRTSPVAPCEIPRDPCGSVVAGGSPLSR